MNSSSTILYTRNHAREEYVRVMRLIRDWYFFHRYDRVTVEEVINGVKHLFIMPSIKDLKYDFLCWNVRDHRFQFVHDYWNNLFIEGACTWEERKHAIHFTMKYVHYYFRYSLFMIELE